MFNDFKFTPIEIPQRKPKKVDNCTVKIEYTNSKPEIFFNVLSVAHALPVYIQITIGNSETLEVEEEIIKRADNIKEIVILHDKKEKIGEEN